MRRSQQGPPPSLLTKMVQSVFDFVRLAEFEILFFMFFVIVFVLFKDLTARPEYNKLLSKKEMAHHFSL